MKRKNVDDRSDARKMRILSLFDEKISQVKKVFATKKWERVISLGATILEFDPDDVDVNWHVAYSHHRQDNSTSVIPYIRKLESIGTEEALCRANFLKGIESFKEDDYCKSYYEILAVKESGLFTKEMFPFGDQPYALDYMLAKRAVRLDFDAKHHYEDFMDKLIPTVDSKLSKSRYEFFNEALQYCDKEKYEQIQRIIGKIHSSLIDLSGDAFVNWNILTKVHQKWVEVKHPVIKKNLETFAKISLAYLFELDSIFTQETLRIIHAFLFIGF